MPENLRELQNKHGIVYDATKLTILFAEDWNNIQTWLNYLNTKNFYDTFSLLPSTDTSSAEFSAQAGIYGEHSALWLKVPFGSNNNQNWRVSAYATGSFADRFAIERWSNDRTFIANNPFYIEGLYMSLMRNGGNVTIGGEYGSARFNIFNSNNTDNHIIKNTHANGYSDQKYEGNGNTWRSGVGNAGATIADLRGKFFVYDSTNGKIAYTITPNTLDFNFRGIVQATGYKSSDGTAGMTGTIDLTTASSIVVKNGLIVSYS